MSVVVHTPARGGALLVLAGVAWGTGGIAGAILAARGGIHPLPVAAYRLLLGGALVALFLLVSTGIQVSLSAPVVRRLFVAGVLLAVFQASYFAALTLTSVSIATMVTIGSVPVFVTVASAVLFRRIPTPPTLIAIGAALLGLALLTWSPSIVGDRWQFGAGIGLALLAGAGFSALTVLTRKSVAGLDAVHTAAFGCLVGGMLLLPAALGIGMALPLRADVLAAAGYLAIVPTALAYVAYFSGLRRSGPMLAGLSVLLEPVTAAVLAVVLLGDRLGVAGWCGAALLVSAIAASQLRRDRS